jgi:hypothetical protein
MGNNTTARILHSCTSKLPNESNCRDRIDSSELSQEKSLVDSFHHHSCKALQQIDELSIDFAWKLCLAPISIPGVLAGA